MNERFSKDYKRKEAGVYVYIGDYYVLPFDEAKKRTYGWINAGFAILLILTILVTGMANQDSSRTLWIVLPYFCTFLPAALMLLGAYLFLTGPLTMRHSEYENSLMRMKTSGIGAILLSVLNLALEAGYVLTHRPIRNVAGECWYIAGFLAVILICIVFGKRYDKMYAGIQILDKK